LLEALASRGFVIVAVNHPGDTTADWLTGTAVDDATNERQRVEDVALVIAHLLERSLDLPPQIDTNKLTVVGHSYGGFTALAYAAVHGATTGVKGVVGLQPFLTPLAPEFLERITAPVLLLGGTNDTTTPVASNVHAPAKYLTNAKIVIFDEVGHQGCSDIGLYGELAPTIPDLPQELVAMIQDMATSVTGRAGDPWRPVVQQHLEELGAFLELLTPPVI